ncbi:MAG: hypothetical protein JXB42_08190 [Deltaproteobacteria bacterium]|nr:hypothetical protein [Deltaproteobacteria bacterium]
MKYYLGTHHTHWFGKTSVPLFVSYRQLSKRKRYVKAIGKWALDSGAFSEIHNFGKWKTTPEEYAYKVQIFSEEIGNLEWASIQDWICTPLVLKKTGMSIEQHQRKTIESYCNLTQIAPQIKWIPILQGWDVGSYFAHARMYEAEGISLKNEKIVGVGSLAGRQSSKLLPQLLSALQQKEISIHAFGLSISGLINTHPFIKSADSMAWSFIARRRQIQLPQCVGKHKVCNNCLDYALLWRADMLMRIDKTRPFPRIIKKHQQEYMGAAS